MKERVRLTEGTLGAVADNAVPGMTEWFIGNIFRGLKYDPALFVEIWNESGLSKIFINFISKRLSLESGSSIIPQPFDRDQKYDYENAIRMFISAAAREINPQDSEETFAEIIKLFRLNTPSMYGDFIIDTSQLIYS